MLRNGIAFFAEHCGEYNFFRNGFQWALASRSKETRSETF